MAGCTRAWLGLAAATAMALAASGGPALAASPGPLRHEGRWLVDRHGRVVILHGVNMVNKLAPYHPAAIGFGRDDAELIRRLGFNTVRLGIVYKGLEPQRGRYDLAYLRRIERTAGLLGRYGIGVLVDFHQDMYNERFNGEGWPDWAVQDDGLPAAPDVGFPGNYLAMPALWRAYDHFWADDKGPDGTGLQEAYAQAWQVAATRLRRVRAVFGYDLLNEPFPGSQYQSCANPAGCPQFDAGPLTELNRRVAAAIRRVDARKLLLYEPTLFFDFGAATAHGPLNDPGAVFTFHDYCVAAVPGADAAPRTPLQSEGCRAGEDIVFDNADAHAEQTGAGLLLSEFGATDDLATLERIADLADLHMVGWQYWAWHNEDPCCKRPAEGLFRRYPALDSIKQDKVAVLDRAYPRAVAGVPERFRFDAKTRRFELVYVPRRPRARGRAAETEIHVPRRHFGTGYDVEVRGARVVSRPGAYLLRIRNAPGAQKVSLVVTRRGV